MTMVPLFCCDDMRAALAFYTGVLDFTLVWPGESADDAVVSVVRDGAELMLTILPLDQVAGVAAHLLTDDVDALFAHWTRRGLDQSHRTESPVHLRPLDQSWGTREVYVTDPFGNTLRIVQRPQRGVVGRARNHNLPGPFPSDASDPDPAPSARRLHARARAPRGRHRQRHCDGARANAGRACRQRGARA